MRDRPSKVVHPPVVKLLCIGLCAMLTVACNDPDGGDNTVGVNLTEELAPLTLLNLSCADVGIYTETCVLDDSDNPYRDTVLNEFDEDNPDDPSNKFVLAGEIPPGPEGAKSRFYLWATALARRPIGENQWYTARALHELWDVAGDPLVQEQALKAYRSVLDNFFLSVTFFECCANLDPDGNPVPFSSQLNKLTADNLYRTESTGWARLIPGDPLLTLSEISDWGYTYLPATPPAYDDGVITINFF